MDYQEMWQTHMDWLLEVINRFDSLPPKAKDAFGEIQCFAWTRALDQMMYLEETPDDTSS